MREAELHELLLGERDRAYRLALRITGEPESAADAVQEACLSILTAARKGTVGGGVETPRAWFLSAVAHTARDTQKSAHRRRERERKWAVEQSERAAPHAEPAVSREVSETLSLVVGTLEEEFRLPLELHYQEGLSYGEAAAVLRLPKSTVAARVEAALGKLRRLLAARGVNAAPAVVAGGLAAVQLPAAPAALAGLIESLIAGGTSSLGKAVAGAAVKASARLGAKKAAGLALGWKVAAVTAAAAATAAVVVGLLADRAPGPGVIYDLQKDKGSDPAAPFELGPFWAKTEKAIRFQAFIDIKASVRLDGSKTAAVAESQEIPFAGRPVEVIIGASFAPQPGQRHGLDLLAGERSLVSFVHRQDGRPIPTRKVTASIDGKSVPAEIPWNGYRCILAPSGRIDILPAPDGTSSAQKAIAVGSFGGGVTSFRLRLWAEDCYCSYTDVSVRRLENWPGDIAPSEGNREERP